MSTTKPAKNHPWRSHIRNHVAEAVIRRQIEDLEKEISERKSSIKALKKSLLELTGERK
jgi:cell division protein FtsL